MDTQEREGFVKKIIFLVVFTRLMCFTGVADAVKRMEDSFKSKLFWVNYLLPLPQEFEFMGTVTIDPATLGVFPASKQPSAVESHAIEALRNHVLAKTGHSPDGDGFVIRVGVLDAAGCLADMEIPASARLMEKPNADQGYIVQEQGEGMLVTALTPTGVWNGVRTVMQLLDAGLCAERVVLPKVAIVDWPDFAERGVWNEPADWFEKWAPIKINYVDLRSSVEPFARDEPARVTLVSREKFDRCQRLGLRAVGRITHLNFFERKIYRVWPELAGLGDGALAGRYHAHKRGRMHRVPNPGEPILKRLLADMMRSLCEQGVRDISCWLTERPASDGRPGTLAVGQFVLEARALVQAWESVRTLYPDLNIRLFLSTTTDERYYMVCNEAPPEIKIIRACATDAERVRCLPRDLFANPLLEHYAAQGRWIGTYDVPLNANSKVETPAFKLPHRSAHRIRDFVAQLHRRGYSGAVGMMAFSGFAMEICGFNISALAEWSWNLNGRTPREFAVAWATRMGCENPEVVADWSELMGPVEWDVYDSELPGAYSQGRAVAMIQERRMPVLGEGFFRYYATSDAFADKMRTCDQALALADKIECPDFANETRVVKSYIRLTQAIYRIAWRMAADDLHALDVQDALRADLTELADAGAANTAAIRDWRAAYGPPPWHARVTDAVASTERTVQEITDWINFRYI